MSRPRSPGLSASSGGWLVSYSNLLTVCLAVFIALYALARGELEKLRAGPQSTPRIPVASIPTSPTGEHEPGPAALPALKGKIDDAVSAGIGAGQSSLPGFETSLEEEGLLIRLAMPGFFRGGSSEVEPELLPLLEKVGRVLLGSAAQVRVEGHVDREEIAGSASTGMTGWELGFQRAEFVSRFWEKRLGFPLERMSLASYASYRPLPPKKSDASQGAARFANRRIEIVVLKTRH